MKLFLKPLFSDRVEADVHNITCYQYQIRILGINHIHPFRKLLFPDMVAQMHIAEQHQFQGLGQRF